MSVVKTGRAKATDNWVDRGSKDINSHSAPQYYAHLGLPATHTKHIPMSSSHKREGRIMW